MGQKNSVKRGVFQHAVSDIRTGLSETKYVLGKVNRKFQKACEDPPKGGRDGSLHPLQKSIVFETYDELKKSDTAGRVIMIMEQHSEDFRNFISNLDDDKRDEFVDTFQTYLDDIIENIHYIDKIKLLSEEFGGSCVSIKSWGFKPEYFTLAADALTTECVFLSGATLSQSPTTTFQAWTNLVTVMFSSIRDGYYATMRRQRRVSECSASLLLNDLPLQVVETSSIIDDTLTEAPKSKGKVVVAARLESGQVKRVRANRPVSYHNTDLKHWAQNALESFPLRKIRSLSITDSTDKALNAMHKIPSQGDEL